MTRGGEHSALPGLSFVMPVLNEEQYVASALRSVLEQEYPGPVEVVVALGPSTDRTDDVVRSLAADDPRIRTVPVDRAVISAGLNRALAAVSYPVVARVDAHVELPPGYAVRAVRTLLREEVTNVGGVMAAVGETPFQSAVARAYNSRWGLGGAQYHLAETAGGDVESTYLGVFWADAVAAVGGYDETVARGEDWELNHRLRAAGCRVWLDPELHVVYRPRSTPRDLAKQFRATGAWRAVLVRRLRGANSRRYLAPPALVANTGLALASGALAVAGVGGLPVRLVASASAAGTGAHLALVGAVAARSPGSAGDRLRFAGVLLTMHYSWGLGFLDGWFFGAHRVVDRSRLPHGVPTS